MQEESPKSPPRKQIGWLRREGIDLGDAIVQFFSVLLGVLLALLISQWNDHRQQQEKAQATMRQQQVEVQEAMRAIHAELAANRAALRQSAAALTAMAANMQRSRQNQNQPARWCFQWDGWAGTNAANLTDSAYQTAIATHALSNMPFKQAQRIAQTYGHQHVKQKDFDLIQNRILMAGPQPLDLCLKGVLGTVQDEHALDSQYDPVIGPDKAAWPAPPSHPFEPHASK